MSIEPFNHPLDEDLHPPTIKAADGTTNLRRYRVEGVIYATTRRQAQRKLEGANIYLDAAELRSRDAALCSAQERALLDFLESSHVVDSSPYVGDLAELRVYRMRLFSGSERRTLLKSLPDAAASMLDELEMVNFAAHGKSIKQLKERI